MLITLGSRELDPAVPCHRDKVWSYKESLSLGLYVISDLQAIALLGTCELDTPAASLSSVLRCIEIAISERAG